MMNSDASSSSRNALDLMLKYSAVFVAVVYASGFLEQSSLAATVGAGALDGRLADASYLMRGLGVAVLCVGASVGSILSLELVRHASVLFLDHRVPNWIRNGVGLHDRLLRTGLLTVQVIAAFGAMLIISRFMLHLSFRWTVSLAVACSVVNLLVSLVLVDPEAYFSSTARQQLSLLMLVGLGLLVFSVGLGIADGRRELQESGPRARLLIAPDAIDGMKHLGIAFPDANCGTASAEPTDSVRVLYQGESMYVVRTKDGRILQIKSDKVWSVAPSP
jgi:hypothetical protein